MGFPIWVRYHLYIESGPWSFIAFKFQKAQKIFHFFPILHRRTHWIAAICGKGHMGYPRVSIMWRPSSLKQWDLIIWSSLPTCSPVTWEQAVTSLTTVIHHTITREVGGRLWQAAICMMKWVKGWLSLTAFFGDSGYRDPSSPYKLYNHNLYWYWNQYLP